MCESFCRYTEKINVSYLEEYVAREYVWCFHVPPRCTKNTVKHRMRVHEGYLYKFRPVEECCTGYKKSSDGETCIPVCSLCTHGVCVAPNVCQCESGYGGTSCEHSCPLNLWGDQCQYDCECKNNSTCDVSNGKCSCLDGWRGPHCDLKCRPGRFGKQCTQRCNCKTDECDHISGQCICSGGADLCNTENVTQKIPCYCQNGGTCDEKTNVCSCTAGWEGDLCENPCTNGHWGTNCTTSCHCYNDAYCHHISGKCICKPGFTGHRCRNICPRGRYGMNCNRKCDCNNGGLCSPIDGKCNCPEKWTGVNCDIDICSLMDDQPHCYNIFTQEECRRICESLEYLDRQGVCTCSHENFICNESKECVCKDGYGGANCDITPSTDTIILLVSGGLTGFVLMTALLMVCVIVIIKRRRKTKNAPELEYQLNNLYGFPNNIDQTFSRNKESEPNYYHMRTYAKGHVYEEIGEGQSLPYQTLDFWAAKNPRNDMYQPVPNANPKIHNDIIKTVKRNNINFE
ncbi:protein draper-like isoform X2 [Photinus pyralis]|uniref:protein draper-like isoform X2 n=1 Tax=Photinus pyralis TaxID=7054 RepID=UPI00126728C5|nr:protein draper-like isoform X2 [Photinus pyralis]